MRRAARASHRATAVLAVLGTRVPGGQRRLQASLQRLAEVAAARVGRDVALSFALLEDDAMREVNARALAHDYPTDVLAFPGGDGPVLEGEVVISADTARREAARRGHPPYDEVLLYAVHGVLHLLGHDDHDPRGRRRMRAAERATLAALGVGPVFGARRRRKEAPG